MSLLTELEILGAGFLQRYPADGAAEYLKSKTRDAKLSGEVSVAFPERQNFVDRQCQ